MENLGIKVYNSNSLKCNSILGPKFHFRNRSMIEQSLANNFITLIQVYVVDIAKVGVDIKICMLHNFQETSRRLHLIILISRALVRISFPQVQLN